jgi:hypothetical protein
MEPLLSRLITQAFPRLFGGLDQTAPELRPPLEAWMRTLAGGHAPEAYFKHPLAFPTLLLPWWVEQSLGSDPGPELQADIAYSSINGYYFIRMIDNVMDDDAPLEKKLLPALAFFHTEFQTAYQIHFPPSHPFWSLYRRVWFGTAQAAVGDAQLAEINLDAFERLSAQKVSAAIIPVAAICHFHNRLDRLDAWIEFVLRIGKWHQMFNDIFDWYKDSQNGSQTYFLSEASRQKQPGETAFDYIIREGFARGCDQMRAWMRDCQSLAATFHCPELDAYLDERSALFESRAQTSLGGLDALRKLAKLTA